MAAKNTIRHTWIVLAALMMQLKATPARADADYALFDPLVDVCELVRKHYVTETDNAQLVAAAINGMLHKLDPYSEYIPPPKVADFRKRTSGAYEGIGVGIDINRGQLTVISPFEDSPAYRAGVLAGDIILEVNGRSTKGWSGTRAVEELTGPAGSQVVMKVRHRDGSEEQINITRQKIKVPTVRGWRRNTIDGAWDYMLDDDDGIGYIRLSQFTSDTVEHFDRAVGALRSGQLKALILDLRSNSGGLMSAAIEIVDRFIDHGTILATRGAHSPEQRTTAQAAGTYPRFPLVVLIDRGTASASEIVAGALQDHNRAVIVGKRSWGKGSVQRIIRLPNSGAAVKLTTDHYYLPKGRCVHRLPDADTWGVDPDVEEDFDPEDVAALGDLIKELTVESLAQVKQPRSPKDQPPQDLDQLEIPPIPPGPTDDILPDADTEPAEPAADVAAKADRIRKTELAQRLLGLDDQLAQAVKQCRGLLRARPSLQGLAEMFAEEPN